MDREQIGEMAKTIAIQRGYGCDSQDHCDMSCQNFKCGCIPHEDAEIIYNEGYRKQSEVLAEYRKKVYAKMEKYAIFGREYIQRILREVEKEMVGDKND